MSTKKNASSTKSESKPTLVPKLRFPEFRGTEGWELKPMGMYLRESRIAGSKGNVARKITVRLWGNGVFEKKESVQGSINTQYYRRRAGQFIYSKLDFLNQAFGIVPEDLDGYESTVDLPCFDVSAELNPVFLLEYVKRKEFYERVGEAADGSRKAKRIQVETFLECPIAIASRAEQQKIASCLSSLDDLITAQAKKIDLLKTYKKGLMQQLFPREGETQPRLRFPEFRGNGEWKVRTLDSVSSSFSGGTPSTSKTEYYGGDIPFIRSAEIARDSTELFLTREGLAKSAAKMVSRGVVLVALYGANSGDVALARMDGAINQAVLCLDTNGSNAFLYHILSSRKNWIVAKYLQGGQGNLSGEIVKSIELNFPSLVEQARIAASLNSADDLIAAHTHKLEALKTHKKGLMQQLFPNPEQ